MPDPCNETECLVAACERRDTDVPAGLQRSRDSVASQVPLAVLALLAIVAPPLAVAFPIGEVLWLVTFWPAVFLLAAGIVQVRGEK